MKKSFAYAAAFAVAFASSGGQAQPADGAPPPPPPPQSGITFDQAPLFAGLDRDRSGTISAAEFAMEGPSGSLFKDMDLDHDGVLTLDELNASHPPATVDTDHDGKFSLQEFRVALKAMYGQ